MGSVLHRRSFRIAAVAAAGVAAALGVWIAVRQNGDTAPAPASPSTADVSARALRALTASLGRPIYWAGERPGVTYEFTETADRRVYVRYLPSGVRAGSAQPYLTVASYPVVDAVAATASSARRRGSVPIEVTGGVAFYNAARPSNVYLAFPGTNVQIEAFDPDAQALHELVAAGGIRPVSASAAAKGTVISSLPARTTGRGLSKLASQLKRPVFWLGPIAGLTLELSRSPDGRVYVRYLPPHARPGSPKPYLTVASYPVASGYQATKAAAAEAGTVRVPFGNGVAFYARTHPTNVYVAFPGVGEQVEVYDPSAARAHALVAAARVQPVP